MTGRALGSITAADLGMPVQKGAVAGSLSSVRHYLFGEERRTVLIVKVAKMPGTPADHREIAGAASDLLDGRP